MLARINLVLRVPCAVVRMSEVRTCLKNAGRGVSEPAAINAAETSAAPDRATKVAEGVMGAVTEEARKQGLTIEGAKSAAGEISAKVGRVGDAAGKSISDRVTSTKRS